MTTTKPPRKRFKFPTGSVLVAYLKKGESYTIQNKEGRVAEVRMRYRKEWRKGRKNKPDA